MNVHQKPILFNKVDSSAVVRYWTDVVGPDHRIMSPQFDTDGTTVLHCRTDVNLRIPFPRPEGWTFDAWMAAFAPTADLQAMENAVLGQQTNSIDDLVAAHPDAQVWTGPVVPPPPAPAPEPTLAEKKAALVQRTRDYVQKRLDDLAASFGYTNIDSVSKYIKSLNPKYRYEAKFLLDKCTAHWDKCEELAIRYQNSNWEDIPVFDQLVMELPDLAYSAPAEYPPVID